MDRVRGWGIRGPRGIFPASFHLDRAETEVNAWAVAVLNRYKANEIEIVPMELRVVGEGNVLDRDPDALEKRRAEIRRKSAAISRKHQRHLAKHQRELARRRPPNHQSAKAPKRDPDGVRRRVPGAR